MFDLIRCIFCVCLAHYSELDVACVFGDTYANAYLCAQSLECFSELVSSFLCLHLSFGGEGYNGPIKKTKNKGRGNKKWKNSEMEQGDHRLVNRLVSHLRIYFRHLLQIERGMRFMLCIFRVMSDSTCLNNVTFGILCLIHILLCTVSLTKYENVSVFVFCKQRPGI